MPIITNETEAYERLVAMLQPSVEPRIDDGGIVEMLLDNAKRASLWEASTSYAVGNVIIPITRNGHKFICVKGGTSSTSEPAWPSTDYAQVSDGDVTWEEVGGEVDLWDLREAAYQGWQIKLSRAVPHADVRTSSGSSKSKSQIYEHCKAMIALYAPIGIA